MVFLSLAKREAQVASRRRRLYFIRMGVAAAFVGLIWMRLQEMRGATSTGADLLQTMSIMAGLFCVFAGVLRTCDTLAEEKREGTLGLLLLTDLRPGYVLLGKFVSGGATTFCILLAMLPALAIPLLVGGVTFVQFARLAVALLNALFLSICWGFLISSVVRKYLVALELGLAVPTFFAGFAFLMWEQVSPRYPALTATLALFSPLMMCVAGQVDTPEAIDFFWSSLAINHVLAWGCLLLAAQFFPRFWQEAPSNAAEQQRDERIRRWRFGDSQKRAKMRARYLGGNPLVWLATRDRMHAVGLVLVVVGLLVTGWIFQAQGAFVLLANAAILIGMAHAASHAFSEDQKSGALELLLSTRLTVSEIISANVRAMINRFAGPAAIVITWEFGIVIDNGGPTEGLALACAASISLIVMAITLAWVGPWFALRARKPAAATWMTLSAVAAPPSVIWFLTAGPAVFDGGFDEISILAATVCGGIAIGHCILVLRWARTMLHANFREAAGDYFQLRKFEPILGLFSPEDPFSQPNFSRRPDTALY